MVYWVLFLIYLRMRRFLGGLRVVFSGLYNWVIEWVLFVFLSLKFVEFDMIKFKWFYKFKWDSVIEIFDGIFEWWMINIKIFLLV